MRRFNLASHDPTDDSFERDMVAELRRLPGVMDQAVKDAAKYERESKEYTDRTTNLRTHTRGYSETFSSFGVARLVMDEEYASFVRARGLSNIDEAAKQAERAIDFEIAAVAHEAEK